MIHLLKF